MRGPIGEIEYLGDGCFNHDGHIFNARKISLVAGGTGITPVYQLIKATLDHDDPESYNAIEKVRGGGGGGSARARRPRRDERRTTRRDARRLWDHRREPTRTDPNRVYACLPACLWDDKRSDAPVPPPRLLFPPGTPPRCPMTPYDTLWHPMTTSDVPVPPRRRGVVAGVVVVRWVVRCSQRDSQSVDRWMDDAERGAASRPLEETNDAQHHTVGEEGSLPSAPPPPREDSVSQTDLVPEPPPRRNRRRSTTTPLPSGHPMDVLRDDAIDVKK